MDLITTAFASNGEILSSTNWEMFEADQLPPIEDIIDHMIDTVAGQLRWSPRSLVGTTDQEAMQLLGIYAIVNEHGERDEAEVIIQTNGENN